LDDVEYVGGGALFHLKTNQISLTVTSTTN